MKLKIFLFYFLLSLSLVPPNVLAIECDLNKSIPSDVNDLSAYITECQKKASEKQGQALTLKAALDILNSKIRLTQAQIKQTTVQIVSLEKDVVTLSTVLTDLDKTLSQLTKIHLARVRESYIRRDPNSLTLFLSSDSFAKFFTRIRYLSIIKARDQLILSEMETARLNYDTQKNAKVTKQQEVKELKTRLDRQQTDLSSQQRSKNDLLVQTKNDEARYQSLLSQARSELEAINAIIAGNGNEKEVRDVSQGEVIASVINQPSCNSSGAHLHFIISDNSLTKNPFDYLKPIDSFNCSGVNGGGCFDGDPFNPNPNGPLWDWPLSPRIQLNQGYGETWAVRNTWVGNIYRFHNGIDIEGGSLEVKAVKTGKLFRGTYSGSNGCALKYVRVDHKDSSVDTFYLHVNYN